MLKHALAAIGRSTKGATALEYAIVTPVLLLLILAIIEYNMVMYASSVLEGALANAARAGKTGYVNTVSSGTCPSPVVNGTVVPQSQANYIICLVGARVSGLLDPTKLQISFNDTSSTSFNAAADTPSFPTGPCTDNPALANPPSYPLCQEDSQSAGDIVVYTVSYPWTIMTPIMKQYLGASGVYTLKSTSIVKNEPYNVGGTR